MSVSSSPAGHGLVEREAQLARVNRLFDRVDGGGGGVVVVEGAAGIGKSELLAAVGAAARARVWRVERPGVGSETEIAFGVARQLFEPMLRAASPGEQRRLLDGVARVGAWALGIEAGEPLTDRFAAVHGLNWLCANRAERGPLAVVVDDVQWGDDPSLAWVGYLARRASDLPLALLLGFRSGDAGGERGEPVRVVSDGGIERIMLGPLSAAAVGVIVRRQLDAEADETFCVACHDLTGGNPLLLRELLAAAHEQGLAARGENVAALRRIAPSAVGASVLARLGRLGDEAVALARAVAVLGSGAEVMLAARLAGLDPLNAELIADRLAAAQILAPVRPLEFFHPLIGGAVLQDIAPGARRVAHRRAAALLDSNRERELAGVAAHLLASGPAGDGWVVRRLADAARRALESGAPEVAVDYLRCALSEPPAADERGALLFLLGTAEWRTARPDAIVHLERGAGFGGAGAGLRASPAPARHQRCPDRHVDDRGALRRAAAAVRRPARGRPPPRRDPGDDRDPRVASVGVPWRTEAALIHAALGNAPEASRLADEQLELARAFGLPRTLGISLRTAGLVEGGERGIELLRDAVRTLERSQSPLELARARTDYGAALRRAGRRVQARAELERALDLAHHCGARRIADRARAELIAAGAKPRRDAITGRDALTASERQKTGPSRPSRPASGRATLAVMTRTQQRVILDAAINASVIRGTSNDSGRRLPRLLRAAGAGRTPPWVSGSGCSSG
jgi:tetratricopeptide (TPR) repeat protein